MIVFLCLLLIAELPSLFCYFFSIPKHPLFNAFSVILASVSYQYLTSWLWWILATIFLVRCVGVTNALKPLIWLEQFRYKHHGLDSPGDRGFFAWFRDMIELGTYGLFGQFVVVNKRYPGKFPIFGYWAGRPAVFVRDASQNKVILETKLGARLRETVMERMGILLGESLLTTQVAGAQRVRRRVIFHLLGPRLDEYQIETMGKIITDHTLPRWQRSAKVGRPIDLQSSMIDMVSRVLIMSFMGLSYNEIPKDIVPVLGKIFNMIRRMVLRVKMPERTVDTPENRKYNKLMSQVHDFIDDYIDEQKESTTMLGTIIRAFTAGRDIPYLEFLSELGITKDELTCEAYENAIRPVYEDRDGNKSPGNVKTEEYNKLIEPTVFEKGNQILMSLKTLAKTDKLRAQIESIFVRNGEINRDKVKEEMSSMFIGGTESTTGSLVTGFYHLATHQNVITKLRESLKTGTLKDHCANGYLLRVINEIYRLSSPPIIHNHPISEELILPCSDGKHYRFKTEEVI